MYMAFIYGFDEVIAFSENIDKAKDIAIKKKKELCPDEPVERWTWESVKEYFGAYVKKIEEGTCIKLNNHEDIK